jgi:FkbM family methyltransferase
VLSLRQRASWAAHLFKAATRQHHRELRDLFAPYVPADALVVDIGAHAGQFSKLFAAMAPRGVVHAFEPSAYARSVMAPALAVNRIRNVRLAPMGLSDAPGEMVLHTPLKRSTALGFGTAHLSARRDTVSTATFDQTVRLTTLDLYAQDHGFARLDLIKADVEGWEMRALVGGEACLRRFRPTLFLEVDDALLARAGDSPETLFDWLSALGYRGYRSPDLTPAPRWTGAGDYLFAAA